MFSTPGGRPASSITSRKTWALAGESLLGLSTTVLPAAMAAAAMPTGMARGKFQGGITATTPSGR